MSDKILKALMQLFAIVANADRLTAHGRNIVEAFLRQQLSHASARNYLEIFDDHLKFLQGKADPNKIQKRISVTSVKVLRICIDINSELDKKQKYIVLLRLIEFAYSSGEGISELEAEVLSLVANTFHIEDNEYKTCVSFASSRGSSPAFDQPEFLLISNSIEQKVHRAKSTVNETLQGDLWILNIKSAGLFFAKFFGSNQLTLNGQIFLNDTVYVFSPGSVIRGAQVRPVYYSDVARSFADDNRNSEITLAADNIEFVFKNGKKGLHNLSFSSSSGNLIGIMGGSGAGKSTLLNILNGNQHPVRGEVSINGYNIHKEKRKMEGVIGFVPQDDLLMEELTVYQNIFYNSKLCFGNLDDEAIEKKVNELLEVMGLYEIKDLKVGDVLNKMISGGQRKRVNIGLELIRTPGVLFVDEPTSGLSSLDAENVMDLLKQLAISGKLVFVVIHQPSSDVFKLFDKLLILDMGGYPIYYGNPSDSLIYFKTKANYADADEGECGTCGNINPEQVFSIIQSKVLDEFGNPTPTRKISPPEWNQYFRENFVTGNGIGNKQKEKPIPKSENKKPSRLRQVGVFIQRDLLSKLKNTQYLLINFLEAPFLAFLLSYFLKYAKDGNHYIFRENLNLVPFIFMSVIVALFMGLSVSAEEIIRDRKILKREAFLNLSRSSYLLSKISVMFLISAIQTFTYVLIGNAMFGIKDMMFDYWLMLFSVSCFANLLGLNISSAFDSAVTIYILIPLLIIPQIILSGVFVKFENLNPFVTVQDRVPVIGEIMASRWAFEALAVNQFKNNKYERIFFDADKEKNNADFKSNVLQKLMDKLDTIHFNKNSTASSGDIFLLQNELKKESAMNPLNSFNRFAELKNLSTDSLLYKELKKYLAGLKKQYNSVYNRAESKKNKLVTTLSNTKTGKDKLNRLSEDYTNIFLTDFVLNTFVVDRLVEDNHQLISRYQPVYLDGPYDSFIRAQFFVSRKNVFGNYYSTWMVNFCVISMMTFTLAIALYFDVLKKSLRGISNFSNWVKEKIARRNTTGESSV
ncbi:MAG: ATP-binding cassette domain-containing protein [Bacteroidia bacterium]